MSRYNHRSLDNDNYFIDIDIVDALTKVTIKDRSTQIVAKAHALWFREDEYNETIGINVALNRAFNRLTRKNERYWIKQTKVRSY